MNQAIRIFVDGSGADPNGIAGFAWLREGEKPHVEWGWNWTNNEAEYRAVLSAVQALPPGSKATVLCDSDLVVRQLRAEYKVREPRLSDLHAEIQTAVSNRRLSIIWEWVPRGENKADKLLRHRPANLAKSELKTEPSKINHLRPPKKHRASSKEVLSCVTEAEPSKTETMEAPGNTLSATEAARRLGISVHTLYRWIYREKIPAFKVSGQWRLNLKIVEQLQGRR